MTTIKIGKNFKDINTIGASQIVWRTPSQIRKLLKKSYHYQINRKHAVDFHDDQNYSRED